MILKYGDYSHEFAEAKIQITRETVRSDQQAQIGYRETWTINGRKEAADIAALTVAISALEAAYQQDGKDLVLYESDGTTQTAHKLVSGDSLYGTQVTNGPSYPEGGEAEYSTFRNYTISVTAEFLYSGNQQSSYSYQESISQIGTGGERFVVREMRNGPPVRQVVADSTAIQVSQSGSASSRFSQPTAPPPVSPNTEMLERRNITYSSQASDGKINYTTSWSYQFLATGP